MDRIPAYEGLTPANTFHTLLAEAANGVRQGPLASFRLEGEEAWREFRIGACLHDCGKVTTSEVDGHDCD